MKLTFDLPIYTYDIDFAGHVSNIAYIQWMEVGRLKLLETIGLPVHQIMKQGFFPVLVHTHITYKAPLYLGDTVLGELWLSELKNASAVMEFQFNNGAGMVAAIAQQKGLFVNADNLRPHRLQPHERELFQPYLQP